jgi:hypothetical protein
MGGSTTKKTLMPIYYISKNSLPKTEKQINFENK